MGSVSGGMEGEGRMEDSGTWRSDSFTVSPGFFAALFCSEFTAFAPPGALFTACCCGSGFGAWVTWGLELGTVEAVPGTGVLLLVLGTEGAEPPGTRFRSLLIFCFCISLNDIFSFFLGNCGLLLEPLKTDCK